jgi:hypothetical protein
MLVKVEQSGVEHLIQDIRENVVKIIWITSLLELTTLNLTLEVLLDVAQTLISGR